MDKNKQKDLMSEIKKNGIPEFWANNTPKMQASYTLEMKGWVKKVHWKESTIPGAGIGVFSSEPISKGSTYRVLVDQQNLIVLNRPNDIPPLTEPTKTYLANYCAQIDGLCFIMCPGSTLNHDSQRANTELVKISNVEIHGIVTKDIEAGEELVCDYIRFGEPPSWLVELVKQFDIPLPFEGYNDYL